MGDALNNGIEGDENLPLFNPILLETLDTSLSTTKYKHSLSIAYPGQGFKARPLCMSDYDKGYMELLTNLTHVGMVTKHMFIERFLSMRSCHNTYYIIVVEDLNKQKIIASATLCVEQKFIHQTALRGRIEDVVVDELYRGKEFGKLLVDTTYLLAQKLGVYKLSLDCKESLNFFYGHFGFQQEKNVNVLIKRFKD